MSRGTEKVHRAGRFGPRYGTSVRRRVANVERLQFTSHRCPQCLTGKLKRVSTSVWQCRKCDHKFAGGAYVPRTESFGKAQAPAEEIEEVEEQFLTDDEEEPEEPAPEAADQTDEPEPEPEPADIAEDEEAEADEDEAPPSGEADEDEAAPSDEEEAEDIGTLFED